MRESRSCKLVTLFVAISIILLAITLIIHNIFNILWLKFILIMGALSLNLASFFVVTFCFVKRISIKEIVRR